MILCNLLSGAVSAPWWLVVSASDSVFSPVVAVRSVRDSCVKHDGDLAGRLCVEPSGGCVGSVSDHVLSPVVAVLGP